jgi:hypothetical protein
MEIEMEAGARGWTFRQGLVCLGWPVPPVPARLEMLRFLWERTPMLRWRRAPRLNLHPSTVLQRQRQGLHWNLSRPIRASASMLRLRLRPHKVHRGVVTELELKEQR